MADVKITSVDYYGDNPFYRLSVDGVFLQVKDYGADGTVDSVELAFDLEQWRLVQAFFEKHQREIQQVVTRFRETLPGELKALRSRLGAPTGAPQEAFYCERGDSRVLQPFAIKRESKDGEIVDGEIVLDSDRDGKVDQIKFTTSYGIRVHITSWKEYVVHTGDFKGYLCYDTDQNRSFVEAYLKILEQN